MQVAMVVFMAILCVVMTAAYVTYLKRNPKPVDASSASQSKRDIELTCTNCGTKVQSEVADPADHRSSTRAAYGPLARHHRQSPDCKQPQLRPL